VGERTWASPAVELWQADARDLSFLPDASVDCCVTSPPYWGLRAYHAGDGEIGQEATVEEWVASLVAVFREVRRVLRPWGTLWLNCGDAYMGSGQGWSKGKIYAGEKRATNVGSWDRAWTEDYGYARPLGYISSMQPNGSKPGDLAGLAWRLAFALQADGWTLRSANVWAKPAPMPESLRGWRHERCRVKVANDGRGREPSRTTTEGRPQQDHDGKVFAPDAQWADCPGCPKCRDNDGLVLRRGSWRPTDSHEMIFQLTKSTSYYGDREAVSIPYTAVSLKRAAWEERRVSDNGFSSQGLGHLPANKVRLTQSGANLRSVWDIGPEPLPSGSGHYAAFPTRLPEICILASTSERGNCAECGMPGARVVETKPMVISRSSRAADSGIRIMSSGTMESAAETRTVGWRPTCRHPDASTVPPVVLDVFCGSGSTLIAAQRLGRRSIGVDLKGEFLALARRRLEEVPLPLASSVPP